jgi:hypothetical protein
MKTADGQTTLQFLDELVSRGCVYDSQITEQGYGIPYIV